MTPDNLARILMGTYRHRANGTLYRVIGVSNLHATKPAWEPAVVYTDSAGRLWSRPVPDFMQATERDVSRETSDIMTPAQVLAHVEDDARLSQVLVLGLDHEDGLTMHTSTADYKVLLALIEMGRSQVLRLLEAQHDAEAE